MATKKAAGRKTAAKKAAAKKGAAKKSAVRLKQQHYLPPWVVIGKAIKAGILSVDPEFRDYVVNYFDAPSGWVELRTKRDDKDVFRRTHCNNIVIEAAGA